MLKAIHGQEDLPAAREKAEAVVEKLEAMKLRKAATIVKDGCEETLSYFHFPSEHWKRLRTNNALERLNREIRRRTKVVGNFQRRGIGPHARFGPSQACSLHPVGQTSLHEYGTAPETITAICCDLGKRLT